MTDLEVLLLTREYPPHVYGGAGVHVEYLARSLGKLTPVQVLAFGDQDTTAGAVRVRGLDPEPRLQAEDAPVFAPVLRALSTNLAWMAAAGRFGAGVVHAHTWYADFGGILARMLFDVPLVVTLHSMEARRPWKREQLGRGYDVSSWIESTAVSHADAVIAVSAAMREDILAHFPIPERKVAVIHNGIDVEDYVRVDRPDVIARYGIDARRPWVLLISRISHQKGILHFLNAARRLSDDVQIVLCAASPDSGDIARQVESGVADLRATGRTVHWIDRMIPREDAVALYSHATLFCCPSIYEPLGLINLEAMSCRTAVVASAVGGIREVVVDGETGTLVGFEPRDDGSGEPKDPVGFARDLADAMTALLDDPERRAAYGEAGRERAERVFSWDAVARKTLDLYESLR